MSQKLFEDLGFSPQEAAALKLKADLNTRIVKAAAGYTQQELRKRLGTSQPRVSDLLRGKDVQIQPGHVGGIRRIAGATDGDQDYAAEKTRARRSGFQVPGQYIAAKGLGRPCQAGIRRGTLRQNPG